MDLKNILQKTKVKSDKITFLRKPPSIALEERPYTNNNLPIAFKKGDNIETKRGQTTPKKGTI